MSRKATLCFIGLLALAAAARAQPVRSIPLTTEPAGHVALRDVPLGDITLKTEPDRTVHLQLTIGHRPAPQPIGDVRGQAFFVVHVNVTTTLRR